MILVEVISIILCLAELAFATIVAALNGRFLHAANGDSPWHLGRHIFTEVVAGLSILFAMVWLFPFSNSFIHWPADLVIYVMWCVSFGLLVKWLNGACGSVFDWGDVDLDGMGCGEWKATAAFAFLSIICWLVSFLVGLYWVRRHARDAGHCRRRWYRSRV